MGKDRYAPIPLELKFEIDEAMKRPGFKEAYDALDEEYAMLASFLKARKSVGLTQSEVARRMGTTKRAVSRLESSLGDNKHSPSLRTLQKYAKAIGSRLEVRLLPQ